MNSLWQRVACTLHFDLHQQASQALGLVHERLLPLLLKRPSPKPIPAVSRPRRFQETDINTYGQWLIERLIKAFPHRTQRDMIGWLREICWSNEYFFRCRPHAVALAHLQKAHPLAAKPQIKVIFVFAEKGHDAEGLAFYGEIAEWAKSMDVDDDHRAGGDVRRRSPPPGRRDRVGAEDADEDCCVREVVTMSFFSDLFHGNFSSLGTDLTHAPESLAKHPSELYETLGGAAALATGGLALGGLGALGGAGEAAAGGLGSLGGLFGGGAEAGAEAGGIADAFAAGSSSDLATAESLSAAAGGGGSPFQPLRTVRPRRRGTSIRYRRVSRRCGGCDGFNEAGSPAPRRAERLVRLLLLPAPVCRDRVQHRRSLDLHPRAIQGISNNPLKALGVLGGAGALGYDVLQGRKPLADQSGSPEPSDPALGPRPAVHELPASRQAPPPAFSRWSTSRRRRPRPWRLPMRLRTAQSTDPTTNTQLADAINSAQQQATMQVAQLGEQLFQQGMNETQVSAQIMQYLTNLGTSSRPRTWARPSLRSPPRSRGVAGPP